MNAKRLCFFAMVILVSFLTVVSQTEKMDKDPLMCLNDDLSLSEEQLAQIKPVWEKAMADIKALKSAATEEKPIDKDAVKKIIEDRDAQITSVLNPEQQTKFNEMKMKKAEKAKCPEAPTPAQTTPEEKE